MNTTPPQTNFDLLRLMAVGIVVYGNGLVLTSAPPSALWGAPLARIGLDLLFAISGYLAAGSWSRRGRLQPYLTNRLIRVVSALAVCVVLTIVVIGPLASRLPLRAYLLNEMTRRYLFNAVLIPELWLPGVFEGQQWVGTVNPMLWTLAPGLALCALVPVLARFSRPAAMALAAAVLCAILSQLWPSLVAHLPRALGRQVVADSLIEAPFFLVGCALGLGERTTGPTLFRADLAMLCFAANWIMATWLDQWTLLLEWLSLPYMALCFGRLSLPLLGRFGALGNPSYGMYLYAFPLQQFVVARWPGAGRPILVSAALALLAGYLSWHFVEKPALRWAGPLVRHALFFQRRTA